jgi:NAD-dependent dihydropyrimidine dehydrogenase PreA subunit
MVKKEDLISVCQCICRKELKLMGRTCQHPEEVCLMFGNFARYYIDNNFARQISSDEAIKILDLAEENGLVLRPTNSQKLDAICCCCEHACLRNMAALPNPGEIIGSSFKSVIDPELCTGCGDCIEICPMEAVKDEEGTAVVSEERCIGCGLCVERCSVEAISMIEREGKKEVPPENFDKLLGQIAAERGI